jgi:phage tail sheath protein FI
MAIELEHGIMTAQAPTLAAGAPAEAGTGIAMAFGTAPAHTVGGAANKPVVLRSYRDAVEKLGYSDDWERYTLCEAVFVYFRAMRVQPLIAVNVLDPAKTPVRVPAASVPLAGGRALLPLEAIASSVYIAGLEAGVDYDAFYSGENCVVERLEGGSISDGADSLSIAYDMIDTDVAAADIIGGVDGQHRAAGLELADSAFPETGLAPDIIIAPGWSGNAAVAQAMAAKAEKIGGLFPAIAIADAAPAAGHAAAAAAWKAASGLADRNLVLAWPLVKIGGRVAHMSTVCAARLALCDIEAGAPSESPSNKAIAGASGFCLAAGGEVALDQAQANFLNSSGIVTGLRWGSSFRLWGNWTACFPESRDLKDYFIPVQRMFGFVARHLIATYQERVDSRLTRRLSESVADETNIWLNGLVNAGHMYGGRVEFLADDNTAERLMEGKAKFRVRIAPVSPAKTLEFELEYDAAYVAAAFGSDGEGE